jgi:hypothetical protein
MRIAKEIFSKQITCWLRLRSASRTLSAVKASRALSAVEASRALSAVEASRALSAVEGHHLEG